LIRGDEEGPLLIRLQPWGTVTGRLVDADGVPRAGVDLRFVFFGRLDDPSLGWHPTLRFQTTKDGKFRIEGLIPGLKYSMISQGEIELFKNLTLQVGETRDLGDIPAKANH